MATSMATGSDNSGKTRSARVEHQRPSEVRIPLARHTSVMSDADHNPEPSITCTDLDGPAATDPTGAATFAWLYRSSLDPSV